MTAAGTVRIRAPRPDDASRLAELSTQLGYPATAGDIGGRLSRLLPRTEHLLRIAESPEGDVIGWIHAEERQILETGPWCEIMGLVVDAAHRGQGAGAALVADVEAWARERGLRTVKVRSNVVREESHPFYLRLGYTRSKTQHVYLKATRPAPQNTTPG
ncbi:MAG TPA: GNAT family N-acetyltransferase [Gemmatimonadales bacterium]|jgi:GNAT superfamily N-acetyltransferase|nr:GNAT family N-acetyltransferase [Gemmatimonadales bacterium]